MLWNVASASAQNNNIREALRYYQLQKYDSAKYFIDLASQNPETKDELKMYYYRGFIYKEIWSQNEKTFKKSPARLTAIQSFLKFTELNTDEKLKDGANRSLKLLVNSFYNDAIATLTKNEHQLSTELFNEYKFYLSKIDANYNADEDDIKYYNVLGQLYSELYDDDNKANNIYFDKVRTTYEYVLSKDPANWIANYNLGIHFYNEGVTKIKQTNYDVDLITINLVQDESLEMFRLALPYMQKAYELNPKRKETLLGLTGIYWSLNEYELKEKFDSELKKLEEK